MKHFYLNQLTTVNAEEINSVISQNIYLEFLTQEDFELSETQLTHLMNTSNQYGPLNGYSRSILKVITGKNVLLPSFEAAE